MYCKYLSRTFQNGFKCKLYKKHISYPFTCKNCLDFILVRNKGINKISNKQKQLEKNRYSIFTDNLDKCYYCGKENIRIDLHEVYGGSNRKRSILNGFVIPLCRECHSNEEIINKLRKILQAKYEESYGREAFMKIIGKNYLDF